MDKQRERLVELLEEADQKVQEYILENDHMDWIPKPKELAEVRSDYLLANGVIVPPCKVGDSCYPLDASETELTCEEKISRITISERNIIIGYYEHWDYYNHCRKTDNWRLPLRTRILGKGVFLTKEEAENALGGVQ